MLTCDKQRTTQNDNYTKFIMTSTKLTPIKTDFNMNYSDNDDDYDYSDSTYVDYSNRQLSYLPQLDGVITHLRLDNNLLTKVQTLQIPFFSQLVVLDLSYNQIEDLPLHLSSMTGLKELYLNNNLLTQIPDSIGCLTELEILDVSCNRLRHISNEVRKLTNLHHLDLRHNHLVYLPHSLGCLQAKLFTLLVDDNPFESTFYSLVEPILCQKPNALSLGQRTRSTENVKANRWQMIRKAVKKGLHTNISDSPRSPVSPSLPLDSPMKSSFDFSQIGTQLRKISISSSSSSQQGEEKQPSLKIEPKFSHKIRQLGHSLSSGNLRSNFSNSSPPAIPAKNPNRAQGKKLTVDPSAASTSNFDNRRCHTMDGLIFMSPGLTNNSSQDYLSSRPTSKKISSATNGDSPPEFSPTTPELLHRTSHSSELTHTSRSSYDSTSPHESFGDSSSTPFPLSSSQSAPPLSNTSPQYSPSHLPPSHQWLKLPVNLPASNILLTFLRQLSDIWDLSLSSSEHDQIKNKRRNAKTSTVISNEEELESPVTGAKHDEHRRMNIMKEILATEETYVESLQGVVDIYIKPAQEKNIFSPDEMRIVFSKIESVLSLHSQVFLPEFRTAMRRSDPPIGQVFQTYTAFMKMYSMYVNDFDQSNLEVERLQALGKTKKKIKQYFDNAKSHPKHSQLNLQGYLLLPVQRIPRYKLLLQDLLKYTDETHPDHTHLKFALQEISKLADEINERKRDKESHDKVLSVQNRIKQQDVNLVEPHRRFIKEGSLYLLRTVNLKARNPHNISQPSTTSLPNTPASTNTPIPAPSSRTSTPFSKSTTSPSFNLHGFSMGYVVRDSPIHTHPNGEYPKHHSISTLPSHSLQVSLIDQTFTFILFNDIMIRCKSYPNGQLELAKIMKLSTKLYPAKLIGDNELRIVDDSTIYYFSGEKDTLIKWAQAINGR